jgi:hypothetical protein
MRLARRIALAIGITLITPALLAQQENKGPALDLAVTYTRSTA